MKKAILRDLIVTIVRTGGKNTRVFNEGEDKTKSYLVANEELSNIEEVKPIKNDATAEQLEPAKTEERKFLNVVSLDSEREAEYNELDESTEDEDTVLDLVDQMSGSAAA